MYQLPIVIHSSVGYCSHMYVRSLYIGDTMYVCIVWYVIVCYCMFYAFSFHLLSEEKEEYDVTGKKLYLQACEALGVVPVSAFLRNLQSAEVDLRHHGIGPKGAKAIAIALSVSCLSVCVCLCVCVCVCVCVCQVHPHITPN